MKGVSARPLHCNSAHLCAVWVFSKCIYISSHVGHQVYMCTLRNRLEIGHKFNRMFINSSNSLQVIGTSSHWELNVSSVRMVVSGWVSYDMWTITCSTPVTMSSIPALMCVKQRHNSFVTTSKSTLRTSVYVVSTAVPTARRLVSTKLSLESIRRSVPRWSLSVLMLLTARQHFQEKLNTPISPPASIKRWPANTVSLGAKRCNLEKISKNTRMMTMHTSVLPWQQCWR